MTSWTPSDRPLTEGDRLHFRTDIAGEFNATVKALRMTNHGREVDLIEVESPIFLLGHLSIRTSRIIEAVTL